VQRYKQLHIRNGTALGELDHPSYVSPSFRSINLGNVSHQVLSLRWVGDNLYGAIEVLPTPSGKLLMELYKSGRQVGVSSRGWASLRDENGCITIQDDFELITFDFVTEPSTQGAFLRPSTRKHRKIPDQTLAVDLAHPASRQASITGQPMEEAILPMDSHVKAALQRLHRKLDQTQRQAINATFGSGPHNIEESQHQGTPQADDTHATLPPHPTKLPPPGPARPQVASTPVGHHGHRPSPAPEPLLPLQPGSSDGPSASGPTALADAASFGLPNMVPVAAS